MKKVGFAILVLIMLIAGGCGGEVAPGSSSASGDGPVRTLDPCTLLSDAEIEAALGDAFVDTVSDAQIDFATCQYLGELKPGEGLPNLFIQVRTDRTLADWESSGVESAAAYWDNFYDEISDAKTEQISDTSYYSKDSLTGIEALIEEAPDLGEHALFYSVEDTTTQLWLHKDYALFSVSLTVRPRDEGTEKERLATVAEAILAAMP